MEKHVTRRDVLRTTGALAGSMWLTSHGLSASPASKAPTPCLFTKPFRNRTFDQLPAVLNLLGITAADLTCRPGGHVLPENVSEDLPRAVELLRDNNITVPMLTTAIVDANKDHAENIVRTAARLGIKFLKLGYYNYGDLRQLRPRLAEVKAQVKDIAALCKEHGVTAGFHNHSGGTVGGAMWDVWEVIKDLPADAIGSYYDGRHATVEGGLSGWNIGLNLLIDRICMVAVKDFTWQQDAKSNWRATNSPLGEGMVHWPAIFARLKENGFSGPISMHM